MFPSDSRSSDGEAWERVYSRPLWPEGRVSPGPGEAGRGGRHPAPAPTSAVTGAPFSLNGYFQR